MFETSETFVPKIIGDCFREYRTGTLVLRNGSTVKTLYFDCGNIASADSNIPDESIDGFLSRSSDYSRDELEDLFARHISEVVFSMLQWTDFESAFDESLPDLKLKTLLFTPQILLEGISGISDFEFVKNMLGGSDKPLRFETDPQLFFQSSILEPEQTVLLSCIESAPYSANELVCIGTAPEPVVLSTVCALLHTGILVEIEIPRESSESEASEEMPTIEDKALDEPDEAYASNETNKSDEANAPVEAAAPDVETFDARAVMQFCYDVENKVRQISSNASYYAILEVDRTASIIEARESYGRLSYQFHPDRQAKLADFNLNLGPELEKITKALKDAIDVLADPKAKEDYNKVQTQLFKRTIPTGGSIPIPSQSAIDAASRIEPESEHSDLFDKPSADAADENWGEDSEPSLLIDQQAAMEFCYQVETKLNSIRDGATHYQILELERNAKKEKLDAAYKRLSNRFALNRQEELSTFGLDLSAQLTQITDALDRAYNVLADSYSKRLYDEDTSLRLRRENPNAKDSQETSRMFPSNESSRMFPSTGSRPPANNPVPPLPANTGPRAPTLTPTRISRPPDSKTSGKMAIPPLMSANRATGPHPMLDSKKPAPPRSNSGSMNPVIPPKSDEWDEETGGYHKFTDDETVKYRLPKNTPPRGKNRTLTPSELYMRGIEYYSQQEYAQAAAVLRKAVELAPNDPEYWAQLGRVYAQIETKETQAEAAFQKAIRLDSDNPNYYSELGLFHQKNGQEQKALDMFRKALELDPDNKQAKQGVSAMQKGETSSGSLRGLLSKLGFKN